MKNLLIIIVLTHILFSQDDSVGFTEPLLAGPNDTVTMYKILTDTTKGRPQQKEPRLQQEAQTTKSEKIFNNGLTLSLAWAFGGSGVIDDWVSVQERYQDDVYNHFDTIIDPSVSNIQLTALEEPTHQVVSFPIKLGYLHRISSQIALSADIGYAYNGKKTSFIIEEFKDTIGLSLQDSLITRELFRYKTHLQHHMVQVGVGFEYLLLPDYFSIDKVSRAGFTVSASFIPLSLFIENSVYDTTTYIEDQKVSDSGKSHASMDAIGAGWGFSIFGEREFSGNHAGRLFLGYVGALQAGYEGHENITGVTTSSTIVEVDHMFQLGVMLLIGRKNEVVERAN